MAKRFIPWKTAAAGSYVLKDSAATNNNTYEVGNSVSAVYSNSSWLTGSAYPLRRVKLLLNKLGTPPFDLQLGIFADNGSGIPTGAALGVSTTVISAAALTGSAAAVNFDFDTGVSLSSATRYHHALMSSVLGDGSNHVVIRINYNTATGEKLTRWNGSIFSLGYDVSQFVFENYAVE